MSDTSKKRSLEKLFGTKKAAPSPEPPPPTEGPRQGPSAAADAGTEAGPGGYLGEGRYRRGGGVMEKPSLYVRPDQARALRMAAAAKDDPNGKTMSEIVQSLLDQHGYCDTG